MKTICVYCGSNPGKNPKHMESARTLGKAMLDNNINLVYGGASIGVMGEIANTVLAGGGEVIGIIPQGIADK
ncbi:MAG: TIGR00730 family Rossman fold protein, partial [Sphingomonadales bacterium]|nr:TIGR00730 family Rossman fold protein [Sphingomonadales bacterium]